MPKDIPMPPPIGPLAGQGNPQSGVSVEQMIPIMFDHLKRWQYEWLTDPGHQSRLYRAHMDTAILKRFVKDQFEEHWAGTEEGEKFDEKWKSIEEELFPPPDLAPSDFQAMVDTMREEVFGDKGLRSQFGAIIASQSEAMDAQTAQIHRMTEALEKQEVFIQKMTDAKPPDLPPDMVILAAAQEEADQLAKENAANPPNPLREAQAKQDAQDAVEKAEAEAAEKDLGTAEIVSEGSPNQAKG